MALISKKGHCHNKLAWPPHSTSVPVLTPAWPVSSGPLRQLRRNARSLLEGLAWPPLPETTGSRNQALFPLLENSPGRDVSLASCPTAFPPLGTSGTTNNEIQGDPYTQKSPFLAGEPCKRALFTFLIGKQASVLLTTCFYVSSCALADFPDCLSTGTVYCLPQILLPKHLLSGSARQRLLVEVMLSGKEVVSASNSLPR